MYLQRVRGRQLVRVWQRGDLVRNLLANRRHIRSRADINHSFHHFTSSWLLSQLLLYALRAQLGWLSPRRRLPLLRKFRIGFGTSVAFSAPCLGYRCDRFERQVATVQRHSMSNHCLAYRLCTITRLAVTYVSVGAVLS